MNNNVFNEGYEAYGYGESLGDCPYDGAERRQWVDGWIAAQREAKQTRRKTNKRTYQFVDDE